MGAQVSKLMDMFSAVVIALGGAALVLLILVTGWQVYGRYVLNDTPTWAERLSLLLILLVSLPVAAVGLRERFHLRVEFALELLPRWAQRALALLNSLLLCLFGMAMAWYSMDLVERTWNKRIPLLGWPQAFQYLPLVLTGGLIALFMIERLLRVLLQRDESGRNA